MSPGAVEPRDDSHAAPADRDQLVGVGGGRRQMGEPVVRLENKEGGCQGARSHGRIAPLQPPQRVPVHEESRRYVGSGDPALPARQREIATQLPQGVNRRERHGWFRIHASRHLRCRMLHPSASTSVSVTTTFAPGAAASVTADFSVPPCLTARRSR